MKKIIVVLPLILMLCAFMLPQAFAGLGDDNKLINYYTWTGKGGAVVAGSTEGYSYVYPGNTESWSFNVAGVSGTVAKAYLYIAGFSQPSESTWVVNITDPTAATTTLATGAPTPYDKDDDYENFRFDRSTHLASLGANVNGAYTVTIKNTGSYDFAAYGAAVVIVFSDLAKPTSYVWVNDGCERILDNVSTTTLFASQGQPDGGVSASLYTIVGGGDSGLNEELYFDGNLLATNSFNGSNGTYFDVDSFNVLTYMGTGAHNVTFYDDYDGIIIYSAVLVYTLPTGSTPGVPEFGLPAFLMLSVAIVGLLLFRRFTIPAVLK